MARMLFDIAAERLEQSTDMDRLAVRGTLRLALKEAGLDAESLNLTQLRAVFERLMPRELETRGVEDASSVCRSVMNDVATAANSADLAAADSPDDIFRRLGRS